MKTEQQIKEKINNLTITTQNIEKSELLEPSKELYVRVNETWKAALEWVLED